MRFPISWLRDFVPISEDIEKLSRGFTFSGTEVEEVIDFEGEKVFDFNFTVNRPDLMSVFGLSRESAAIFDLNSPNFSPNPQKSSLRIADEISIEVSDMELCPRYKAYIIKSAKVGHSTPLIQKRLIQCGLRPINAVVDATNYVLLEYGHPLHAFDIRFIKGNKIVVRRAKEGEKIRLLDGSEKKLSDTMLVIADAERALAIAGVMGGEESGVTFLTRDILLEGAVFNPVSIRRTAKKLNLHTDASHRFERGSDFEGPVKALDRVSELILDMCGGQLCQDGIDIKTESLTKQIDFRIPLLKRILGIDVPKEKAIRILNKLGFSTEEINCELLRVSIPSFRVDVEREIDIVEEVIRIYGLDKLHASTPYVIDDEAGRKESQNQERKIRHFLSQKGLYETISFSMTDPILEHKFSGEDSLIKIKNPLSETNSVLRRNLISNLILIIKRNSSFGCKSFGIFELGKVYLKCSRKDLKNLDNSSFQDIHKTLNDEILAEEEHLAILLYEEEALKSFNQFYPRDIYQLKGIVESLFLHLHKKCSFKTEKPFSEIFSKENFSKIFCEENEVGFMAYLEPLKLKELDIIGKVCIAELKCAPLLKRSDPSFKKFSKFPVSRRDISILLENTVNWTSIYQSIMNERVENLLKIELIEVYQDEKIGKENKSMTLALYFQSIEKTLSELEIEESLKKIVDSLKSHFKIILR